MELMFDDLYERIGTITVEKEGNGHYALHKNRHPAYCPFVNPVLVPDRFGNATFSRVGCTTGCPHANIHRIKEGEGKYLHYYNVACGGHHQDYAVDIKPEEEDGPAPDSLFVRL